MSGIVGCVGLNAQRIVKTGLESIADVDGKMRKGYDSAGLLLAKDSNPQIFRHVGRADALLKKIPDFPEAIVGLGHLRWSTSCRPSEQGCHPHADAEKTVWIVHNGHLENWTELRDRLSEKGRSFLSGTDSECLAIMIADYMIGGIPFSEAFSRVMESVEGPNIVAAYSQREPGVLLAGRKGRFLGIAARGDAAFVASEPDAFPEIKLRPLNDGEVGVLRSGFCRTTNCY